MSNKKVLTGAERKAQLLEAGAKLASKHGAVNVTRRMVAQACKCAEGLVSVYMGDSATAQKAYARKAKALGLTLPDKAKTEAIGAKLRAHGPRDKRDTRKRSAREVQAIKDKAAGKRKVAAGYRSAKSGRYVKPAVAAADPDGTVRETKPAPGRESKPVTAPARAKPSPGKAPTPPERKATAARKPKAPPKHAVTPTADDRPALPLPPVLAGSFP